MTEPTILPMVPEPDLTREERAALSEAMRDPEFWRRFEQLPEPLDDHRPTRSEQSLEGAAVNGLTPVGQEAASE